MVPSCFFCLGQLFGNSGIFQVHLHPLLRQLHSPFTGFKVDIVTVLAGEPKMWAVSLNRKTKEVDMPTIWKPQSPQKSLLGQVKDLKVGSFQLARMMYHRFSWDGKWNLQVDGIYIYVCVKHMVGNRKPVYMPCNLESQLVLVLQVGQFHGVHLGFCQASRDLWQDPLCRFMRIFWPQVMWNNP